MENKKIIRRTDDPKSEVLNFRLTVGAADALRERAEAEGISLTLLVTRAVKHYLANTNY